MTSEWNGSNWHAIPRVKRRQEREPDGRAVTVTGVGSGGQGVSDTQSERYGWRNEVTASRTRRSLTHYVAEGVASEARRQARDESNEMRDRRLAREPGHK